METKCKGQCMCSRHKSTTEIPQFKKILEVKEIGLCIYQHVHRNPETNFNKDVYIMCNKSCMEITNEDIRRAFEMYATGCPRCDEVISRLHNLLEDITSLAKNKIVGICDHCKRRAFAQNKPCECDKISKIFINVKPDGKLSKGDKDRGIRTKLYSDITTREPKIEPCGFQNMNMPEKRGIDKKSRSIENVIKDGSMSVPASMHTPDDLTLEQITSGKAMKKGTSDENLILNQSEHLQSILSSDKEFKLKETTTMKAPKGKTKKPLKGSKLSFATLARDFSTDYEKHVNHTPELDNILSSSDFEMPMIPKIRKDFLFYFPKEKPKKESTLHVTSAELIQATRDKIRMNEMLEKERKNLLAEKRRFLDLENDEKREAIALDAAGYEMDDLEDKIDRTYLGSDLERKKIKDYRDEETEQYDDINKLKKHGTAGKYKTTRDKGSREVDDVRGKSDMDEKYRSIQDKESLKHDEKRRQEDKEIKDDKRRQEDKETKDEKRRHEGKETKDEKRRQEGKETIDEKRRQERKEARNEKLRKEEKESGKESKRGKAHDKLAQLRSELDQGEGDRNKTKKVSKDGKSKTDEKGDISDSLKDKRKTIGARERHDTLKIKSKLSGILENDILSGVKIKHETHKEKNEVEKIGKKRLSKDTSDEAHDSLKKGIDHSKIKIGAPEKIIDAAEQKKLAAEARAREEMIAKAKAEKTVAMKDVQMKRSSLADMTQLVKLDKNVPQFKSNGSLKPLEIDMTKTPKGIITSGCEICRGTEDDTDLREIRKSNGEVDVVIIGNKVHKYKRPTKLKSMVVKEPSAMFFKTEHSESSPNYTTDKVASPQIVEKKEQVPIKEHHAKHSKHVSIEQTVPRGVIQYALSDRSFIDNGWTVLPTERVVRKLNVYRMRPAQPEFDWFANNKNRGDVTYEDGSKFVEFNENGTGRWYYRNGRLALDYYDAEEQNAHQRFIVYSNGENDENGNARPYTVLASFDHLGNAVVYDHSGNIRMKYNQTEGILLDTSLGPETHWKWHTLNEPPILQQVMIDTYQTHKDPDITKLGNPPDEKYNPENEEMLAIEFENSVKEKAKKLSQKFKPYQIRMKALKINENFSLKVLDQASVYLIFRDGLTNIKLNMGMKLDHQEIIDTDTTEVGMVSTNMEVLPAKTESVSVLQKIINQAQFKNKLRVERNKKLKWTHPMCSKDRLMFASSKPPQLTSTVPSTFLSTTTTRIDCRCSSFLYKGI